MQPTQKKPKLSDFAEDLIENLPVGVMILDRNGKIIRMNKAQEKASRIEREKILGRTFPEAFPRTLEQGLMVPYLNMINYGIPFDIFIDRYIPQYYSKQMMYHVSGAAFSKKTYFIILSGLADELYREKRLVEKRTKELQDSENFLNSLIDSSLNIIISTDLTDRIIVFSKTAEKIFGYTKNEVNDEKINFLFKDMNFKTKIELKKPSNPLEVICVKKDKSIFPASLVFSDIKIANGKTIARLYFLSDLTESKELEERLMLSEKLALYTELMGGIAHQLNNPLIGVVNFSEMLLKETERKDAKREIIETIARAGKECLKITTSVMNSIKHPSITFSKIDINEVLKMSINCLNEQSKERLKKVSVHVKTAPRSLLIRGDSIQLNQCFLNILNNAIQSLLHGQGSIRVETIQDRKKGEITVSISDTGSGIPKEYLNRIFLPFFSLNKSPKRRGLGLSFAFQIIKNHGGSIRVESELGQGSTFRIALPSFK